MPNTNQLTATQVLIVGAGPTGLTLACELARRNIRFRIIDAAPRRPIGSRGKRCSRAASRSSRICL